MTQCPHRPPCGGCPRLGETGLAAPALAALDALARRHGLPAPVPTVAGPATGFRHRARLAIRGRTGAPLIGMFEPGTHRVVPIPACLVHHPLVNRVAGVVRQALVDTGTSCYSEATHRGLARYLQVVVERRSQSAQVVLVANAADARPLEACLALVRERLGRDLHSLWFNANPERTNTILGQRFERRHGPETVVECYGGAEVHYPPGAFGQNNLEVAERIVRHVGELVPDGVRVAEYYAGVGAIGLSLLARLRTLRLNEVSPPSLAGLDLGLAALAPGLRARVEVVPGRAGVAAATAGDVDVVIVDPPRKGLDAELLDALVAAPPRRLVYVSCGLDSFLRDTARLVEGGRLGLSSLRAFDLMPYTDHVETLGCFDRADAAGV